MKKYRYYLMILSVLFFLSCEKETENLSRSTYYVSFDLKGENPLIVQVGDEFVDPGVVATEQGVDVTSDITVTSNVNSDVMGMYQITYSGVNIDGLKSSVIRDVIVCNPSVTTDISGTWYATDQSVRVNLSTGAQVQYGGPTYLVKIDYLAPGFFYITDLLGGYYAVRVYPQYGSMMWMTGYVALNEDNTLSHISSYIDAWGDSLDFLKNASYDPETNTIKWEAGYAGTFSFNVQLNKK